MFPAPKIVVIDDEVNDLKVIIGALKSLGLGCISYHYPDERPDEGVAFGGLRLFITDINLIGGDSPGDQNQKLAPVISLLGRIIAADNGPYALITWSTTELHNALVERIGLTDTLKEKRPFFSVALAKSEFLNDNQKLREAVKNIFTANAPFGALLDWERRVSRAGEKVLYNIDTFAQKFDGSAPSEKMDRMLSKLAVDAFGKPHVADHVFESINEALLPILSDALNTEFFSTPPDGIWEKALTKYNEDNALASDIVAKLNTSVNLETSVDIKPYRRGAVLEIPELWLSDGEFEKRFGLSPKRIRGEILKLDLPKFPKWVLVQAQAACDFAQGRVGPIPYLLAAVVPSNFVRKQKDGQALSLPASVAQTPRFAAYDPICNTDFHLEILHGMVTHITRNGLGETTFKVVGRLKDQIVSSIGYEHHSHGSRPGFISFR